MDLLCWKDINGTGIDEAGRGPEGKDIPRPQIQILFSSFPKLLQILAPLPEPPELDISRSRTFRILLTVTSFRYQHALCSRFLYFNDVRFDLLGFNWTLFSTFMILIL